MKFDIHSLLFSESFSERDLPLLEKVNRWADSPEELASKGLTF
jgi:hypothetical protein